jgi:hypothetical protein
MFTNMAQCLLVITAVVKDASNMYTTNVEQPTSNVVLLKLQMHPLFGIDKV